jgi:hypothetical protein
MYCDLVQNYHAGSDPDVVFDSDAVPANSLVKHRSITSIEYMCPGRYVAQGADHYCIAYLYARVRNHYGSIAHAHAVAQFDHCAGDWPGGKYDIALKHRFIADADSGG